MLLFRFRVTGDDYRPTQWPPKHPYWITGYVNGEWHMLAYADSHLALQYLWPQATHVEERQVEDYSLTAHYRQPSWLRKAVCQ